MSLYLWRSLAGLHLSRSSAMEIREDQLMLVRNLYLVSLWLSRSVCVRECVSLQQIIGGQLMPVRRVYLMSESLSPPPHTLSLPFASFPPPSSSLPSSRVAQQHLLSGTPSAPTTSYPFKACPYSMQMAPNPSPLLPPSCPAPQPP